MTVIKDFVGAVGNYVALTALLLATSLTIAGVVVREYVLTSSTEPGLCSRDGVIKRLRRYPHEYRRYLRKARDVQRRQELGVSAGSSQSEFLTALVRAVRSFADWQVLVPAIACTVMRAVLQVATPVLDGRLLDMASESAQVERDVQIWRMLCVIRIGFAVLNWMAHTLHGVLFARVNHYMTKSLRETVFRRILSQNSSFLVSEVNPGELQTTLMTDCAELVTLVTHAIEEISATLFGLLLGGFVSFRLDWKLSLLSVLIMVPSFLLFIPKASALVSLYHTYYNECQRKVAALSAELTSARTIRTIQLSNAVGDETNRYCRTGCLFIDSMKHFNVAETGLIYAGDFALWTMGAILLIGGSFQIMQKRMDVGHYVAFRGVISMLNEAIRNMGSIRLRLARFLPIAQRVFGILDRPSMLLDEAPQVSSKTASKTPIRGHIIFQRVRFHYEQRSGATSARQENEFVLGPIDLEVRPGQTMALVGDSGGGKSSILSLLTRIRDSHEGRIIIDGRDTREFPLSELRGMFGYIEQDPVLLNRSIAENIALGNPQATMREIEEAAKVAHAHAFISSLPEGYETVVGENGSGLSGGQRQRTAIARAILGDPSILLMDEATSALDTVSESQIQAALSCITKRKTTIVIAHRLSTIKRADTIAVLKNGMIVEAGTHEKLVARKDGYYRHLLHQQLV